MVDTRSAQQRRHIMQSVKQRDTGPELLVRKLLFRLGYRYIVHKKDLPGTPDIVFTAKRKVVFVHGCYWHGHSCPKGRLSKSREDYWGPKIARNQTRDATVEAQLQDNGWETLTVWQCELSDEEALRQRLTQFLGGKKKHL